MKNIASKKVFNKYLIRLKYACIMMLNWKCMVQKQINIAENVYKAIWQSKFYFYIWEFEFFLTLLYKKMYQHVHICTLQLIFKYQFNWIYKILKYQKCKCTLIQYDLAIWTCTSEQFDFGPLLYMKRYTFRCLISS